MDDLEKIRLIMQEVGPLDDGIEEVLQIDETNWVVRFQDVDVEAEFDGASGRLMLTAEIGAPPDDASDAFFKTLLVYSMVWKDTSGGRMGMRNLTAPILQMVDLETGDLTPKALAIVVHNLDRRTKIWRRYFDGGENLDIGGQSGQQSEAAASDVIIAI